MLTKHRKEASRGDGEPNDRRPTVELRDEGGRAVWALSGVWNTRSVHEVDGRMRELEAENDHKQVVIDISGIRGMDTAGAWLIERLVDAKQKSGVSIDVTGESEAASILLPAVREAIQKGNPPPPPARPWFFIRWLELLGRVMVNAWNDFIYGMYILGSTIRGAQMKLGRGHAVNPAAIFNQIDRMGVGAIPVVILMSSIVGAIIAQQGAFQLRYFGAEIFIVDLVGVLVLRELGVLLTAIMVAGRSGSAITAEIGSMKMREEVDALTVIGLNPVGVLVFPRLVALVVAVPCLTVAANAAALAGAMAVAWFYSGIAPEAFIDRMRDGIDLSTIFAGLIKAPFMALIIGIIASVEGMKVGGSAESLGRHVTASVVKAIFIVIVLDGLFAMFYAAIDF
ncbi:ABC transporter permease [Aquamicrobium sp. LC103]|uniref:ABC transporter permease n=1 Tax=Aquamicrobium sp. LC103 TaxID=1120658 RepID=UPI00063EAC17|nr:ABC transporter permease [Aquamicrobium sp. LC103]TKT76861.1 organic solvent ABC transporter permease [Aquamicrobium sp. LC103]